MRILDLFCGGGAAADGYVRAGHEVSGVDIAAQPCYPYEFIRMDAIDVLMNSDIPYRFDVIHASPPCQPYSKHVTSQSSPWNDTKGKDEESLIPMVRWLLERTGKPFVIENVVGAPLHDPVTLCGSMFGLDIPRHRLFETNWGMDAPLVHPKCRGIAKRSAERRGWDYRDMSVTGKGRSAGTAERWAELLGMDRVMRQHDLKEAIPPAYTEYVGGQLWDGSI